MEPDTVLIDPDQILPPLDKHDTDGYREVSHLASYPGTLTG